jgi:hypothetical protein
MIRSAIVATVWLISSLVPVDAQDGNSVSPEPSAAQLKPGACKPSVGSKTCYFKRSSCLALVLTCTDCCYGDQGEFTEERTSLCGVCVGLRF